MTLFFRKCDECHLFGFLNFPDSYLFLRALLLDAIFFLMYFGLKCHFILYFSFHAYEICSLAVNIFPFLVTGLHVVVTMFTGYLVGYAAFRALFSHNVAMVTS